MKRFVPLWILCLSITLVSRAQEIGALEPGGYLISKELQHLLENEVSGEIAKRYVEAIARFHRIRGGGGEYRDSALYINPEATINERNQRWQTQQKP